MDAANSTIADLNRHLQEVQSNLTDAKHQLEAAKAKPPPFTDDLGTL